MLIPDDGPPARRLLVEVDGFPRGLAVLPDHYVLGVSDRAYRADRRAAPTCC